MKIIEKIVKICAKAVSYISFVGIALGVAFVVVDVILRYVFQNPIHGDYDITQLWLCVIIMAAMPYVQVNKGHINVTMAIKRLPVRPAMVIFAIATVFGAAMSIICAYACFSLAMKSFARNMVSMTAMIPYGPFEIFEGVCMALLGLVMLVDAVYYFMASSNEEKCKEIIDSWA